MADENLVVVDRPTRDLEIDPMESGGRAYKMPISRCEHFLIERRHASSGGYDRDVPQTGLLIWHIDRLSPGAGEERQPVDLECADGLYADCGYPSGKAAGPVAGEDNLHYWAHDAEYCAAHLGNLGDATDVFDGLQFTQFRPSTNPSSSDRDGTPTGHRVENIRRAGARMAADLVPGPTRFEVCFSLIDNGTVEGSSGDMDGGVDPGETIRATVRLINKAMIGAYGVRAVLRIEDPLVSMIDSTAEYGDVPAGSDAEASFRFALSATVPQCEYDLEFTFEAEEELGSRWELPLTRYVGSLFRVDIVEIIEHDTLLSPPYHWPSDLPPTAAGNGDGLANPGEVLGLRVAVRCQEGAGRGPLSVLELRSCGRLAWDARFELNWPQCAIVRVRHARRVCP